MFNRKKGPTKEFLHAGDCKIKAVDPTVKVQWSEIRRGVWEAVCVCGRDYWYDPVVDDRVRLDPFDPQTSRHAGECQYRDETDPAQIRLLLGVKDGTGGDYHWVTCHSCGRQWQVPYYAAENVR